MEDVPVNRREDAHQPLYRMEHRTVVRDRLGREVREAREEFQCGAASEEHPPDREVEARGEARSDWVTDDTGGVGQVRPPAEDVRIAREGEPDSWIRLERSECSSERSEGIIIVTEQVGVQEGRPTLHDSR